MGTAMIYLNYITGCFLFDIVCSCSGNTVSSVLKSPL